jgi:DNA (cytosine-5)-methyltransferase 1
MKVLSIADLFCGAGGTSSGALQAARALGFNVKLTAINHWDIAIATHTANHPETRHLCTSLDNVNPRTLFAEGELDVLWASPECTHHSVARGGKPMSDQSRATAWCVVRWAEALRPNVILVENVPEFVSWGALDSKGRPLKSKKGSVFQAWKSALESLGYRVSHRVLCAADYGDPTTRRRLFIQAVRGRRRTVWPEPTHSPRIIEDLLGSRRAWVPARDIIDWSISGKSIYDRKKPLSEKTMRRIMAGLKKFGLKPFFVQPGHGEHDGRTEHRVNSVDQPIGTIPCSNRFGIAEPFLVELRGTSDGQINSTARSLKDPAPTVTAGGGHLGLIEPFLVQVAHGNGSDPNADNRRSRSVSAPFPTVCGSRGEWAVCEPSLLPQHGGGALRRVSSPVSTVTTDGAIGLVQPFIMAIDHTGSASHPIQSIDDPISTVTTEARHAVVEPFLVKFYGTGIADSVEKPLDTVTSKDRFGLVRSTVMISGNKYLLDILFRMLQPHELAAAQGFPKGYRFTGNKSDQVKQIGNAVPCGLARAIVAAVLTQNSDVSWLHKTEAVA